MNATEETISKKPQEKLDNSITVKELNTVFTGTRSIRPQKSMMRIKSCRPQKLKLGQKLRTKAIVAK